MRRLAGVIAIGLALLAPAVSAAKPPPIRHVFVIVLENKGFSDAFVAGRTVSPYLSQTLPSMGLLIPGYYGIGHSSADNYLAMVSGQPPTPQSKNDCPDPLADVQPAAQPPYGVAVSDGCVYPDNFKTVADQLAGAGLTWRGYMEDIPAPCSLAHDGPNGYARKHNPFVFFMSLRESGQCAANDVSLSQLPADLANAKQTPNLVYITPNECDDGHSDCSAQPGSDPVTQTAHELAQADAFLRQWVPQILASQAYRQNGLLIVTFDESDADPTACCNEQPGPADPNPGIPPGPPTGFPPVGGSLTGGGDTGAVLLSKFIQPGSITLSQYNHYSLLRSIEDLFGLGHLGYAGQAGLAPFGDDVYNGR